MGTQQTKKQAEPIQIPFFCTNYNENNEHIDVCTDYQEYVNMLGDHGKFNNKSKKRKKHRRFQEDGWDIRIENGHIIFINKDGQPIELLDKEYSLTMRSGSIIDELELAIKSFENKSMKVKILSEDEMIKDKFVDKNNNRFMYKKVYYFVPIGNQKSILAIMKKDNYILIANAYVLAISDDKKNPYNWFYTYYKTSSNDQLMKTFDFGNPITHAQSLINHYPNETAFHDGVIMNNIYQSDVDNIIESTNNKIIRNGFTKELFKKYLINTIIVSNMTISTEINNQLFSISYPIDNQTKEFIQDLINKLDV